MQAKTVILAEKYAQIALRVNKGKTQVEGQQQKPGAYQAYYTGCPVRCVGVGNFYRLPMEKVPLGPETPKTQKKIFWRGPCWVGGALKFDFLPIFKAIFGILSKKK